METKITMAQSTINIYHHYDALSIQCADYISKKPIDKSIHITKQDIQREQSGADIPISPAYAESLAAYRKIGAWLPTVEAFILHGAVVAVDGQGYAFLAPSGTGKSTHVAMWHRLYGGVVVNGDKPIIRRQAGEFYAHGTPWCGKEGWQTNMSVPLRGLCFLTRGSKNRIVPMVKEDAVSRFLNQVLRPQSAVALRETLALVDGLLRAVPCYQLWCTEDLEAAQVAYKGMCKNAN